VTAAGEQHESEKDARFMDRALQLAQRGRTHPNPMVGAIVVRDGQIVGEGFHPRRGEAHAEAFAFADAGEAARGATLYVTLEPCSHTDGGRTPCVARCLRAGVARVVGAMTDPDGRVSGRGFAQLRAAGVEVVDGVREAAARRLNRAYVKHRTTGLPYVTHKAAMTLDGKIAASGGDSKWITGEPARRYVHRHLRHRADALVVGIGTVLADDPTLTTRLPRGNGHDPLRVLIDSGLRTPPGAAAVRAAATSPAGTLIVGSQGRAGAAARRACLEAAGAEVVLVPPDVQGRADVRAVARLLAERGALDVLLEGGSELAASFWEGGLVDNALFFIAPKIVGGRAAPTPLAGTGIATVMADAVCLERLNVRRFGQDIALEGEVQADHVYRNR